MSGSHDETRAVPSPEAPKAARDSAVARLLPLIYQELRELASRWFRGERADHTLQPTALVHEAFLRLVNQSQLDINDRTQLFGLAAHVMRQVLVDHARRHQAVKRGKDYERVELDTVIDDLAERRIDLLELDDALTRLAGLSERQSQVVELRFFGGLSVEEAADILGVSKTTAEGDWRAARAWLSREMSAA